MKIEGKRLDLRMTSLRGLRGISIWSPNVLSGGLDQLQEGP